MPETFITVAIHTYDFAVALRDLLVENGIQAKLENVNISNPMPACGIRVRIPESMLPLALKVIEADSRDASGAVIGKIEGEERKLLVPIDFSHNHMPTIGIAFSFAAALQLKPVLLNVYATPYFDGSLSGTDNFTLDIRDTEMRKNLANAALDEMKRLKEKIAAAIAEGTLPAVAYDSLVREGLPEDVILEYTRTSPPEMILMSTRGIEKKAAQLIGSVTAEVIDSCRVPVFTVPEDFSFSGFNSFKSALFFCNVDQHDLLAMDVYVRLCAATGAHVCLIPVNDKSGSKLAGRMEAMRAYFADRYPGFTFSVSLTTPSELRKRVQEIVKESNVQLLIVPNKKKNIFARLLNPGIAHKVIFEADVPMLALPV